MKSIKKILNNKKVNLFESCIKDLILPSIILLSIIVIIQLFIPNTYALYSTIFKILEIIIILIFLIDLIFKYLHILHLKEFIKKYWLDILVVFPFFLLFTSIEKIFYSGSKIIRNLDLNNEINAILNESERSVDSARRFNKIWPRLVRILKIIHYKN